MSSILEALLPGLAVSPDLHPVVIHFPVALWLTAAAAALWGVARRDDRAMLVSRVCLYVGTVTAAAALLTGYLAAERLGHSAPGHELVHAHRNVMIAATALGAVASTLAWLFEPTGRPGDLQLAALLVILAAVTIVGADRGARLVYGHGFGLAEGVSAPPPPASALPHDHGGHGHGGHHH